MSDTFGLSNSDYCFIKNAIQDFCSSKQSIKILVFGSRARGNYQKYSDLDIWVETSPALNTAEITELKEFFEESDLSIKIDIVSPQTVLQDYLPNIQKELIEF